MRKLLHAAAIVIAFSPIVAKAENLGNAATALVEFVSQYSQTACPKQSDPINCRIAFGELLLRTTSVATVLILTDLVGPGDPAYVKVVLERTLANIEEVRRDFDLLIKKYPPR